MNDRFLNHTHLPESERIFYFLAKLDFEEAGDYFCWKYGGDGDNGEVLMNELDEYFKRNKVDAEPVRHGEWINDKGIYRCSACNELWLAWWASVVSIERMNKEMRFCPNCGAKMDGERKEE